VPTFTCGFVRSNLLFAMTLFPVSRGYLLLAVITASATLFGASA